MKKLSIVSSFIASLLTVSPAFAQNVLDTRIRNPGNNTIIAPDTPIGQIISFAIAFIIVMAFLLALIFVVIGAFQWITSGGDKQKVADARNHILAAVIGLIIIALSFVIINVVITALGLGSLTNLQIKTLQDFR